MKGRIIHIDVAFRPNPDGTTEGMIAMKSDNEENRYDELVWKTDPQPTKLAVADSIIQKVQTMKTDLDRCLAILKMEKQKMERES